MIIENGKIKNKNQFEILKHIIHITVNTTFSWMLWGGGWGITILLCWIIYFCIIFPLCLILIFLFNETQPLKDFHLENYIGYIYVFSCLMIYLFNLKYYWNKSICKHGSYGINEGLLTCSDCKREEEEIIAKQKLESIQQQEELKARKVAEERRKIKEERIAKLKQLDQLIELDPLKFEDEIAKMFRALNYKVMQTPYSNDGGKDAIIVKDGIKYLVECKRYSKDNIVGRPELQKFYSAIIAEGAEGGFFITTSTFNKNAYDFINNKNIKNTNIELVDGNKLVSIMEKAYPKITSDINGALDIVQRKDIDFAPYMEELQRSIKGAWTPPEANESKSVIVVFKLDSAGRLSDLRIKTGSGYVPSDDAALLAVRDAAPFSPLPQGAPAAVDIEFMFDYNVFGAGEDKRDNNSKS